MSLMKKILSVFFYFKCSTGGFGGLHALGILFAIKFKIIIVASIIAFAVYYYAKFISVKKCHGGDHLREGGIFPVDSS